MSLRKQLDEALGERQEATDWTPIIKFIGALIYLSGIIYAGSHVLSFVASIMSDPFLRVMGYIGGVGIILNGAVLPLAIHTWTLENRHRLAGIGFYTVDLALIAGFVWANTNAVRGVINPLAEGWLTWVSPLTFMNTILTWGVLYVLDPANRVKFKLMQAQQEAALVEIEAGILIDITEAEARAQQRLLNSGIDIDTGHYSPTRTTIKYPDHTGREYMPVPEQPERPLAWQAEPEPFWSDPQPDQPEPFDFSDIEDQLNFEKANGRHVPGLGIDPKE